MMIIKGSLLVLLLASVYADDLANNTPGPNNSSTGGDKTVSKPSRRWKRGGTPSQASSSAWGGGQGRARTGRTRGKPRRRRRWGRPANWVRPSRPADNDWAKPLEPESWDTAPDFESWDKPSEPEWVSPSWGGDAHNPTKSPTKSPNEGDYQVCDKTNRNICCDLGSSMSEGTKRSVCKALGCNYDKCQWRDDGYGEGYIEEVSSGQYDGGYSGAGGGGGGYTIREYKTVEVVKEERADKYTGGETMEEYEEQVDEYKEDVVKVEEVVKEEDVTEIATPGYISHKVDTTKDSYGSTCDDDAKIFCCNQNTGTLQEKISVCDQLSCAWQKCGWEKRSGWDDDGHKPTPTPTSWKDDGHDQCDVFARNICCTQDDDLTVKEKKEVCDDIGCIYEKCGWEKDGYDDDDESKPAWKNDGYNKDDDDKYDEKYDDKYDVDYKKVKDLYDEQWNYKNNFQKNKYNFKNSNKDDECTADEREECCTANENEQLQVCDSLGCNIRKCDKKEGGWDYKDDEDKYKFKDDYDFKNDYDDDKCTADDLEECCSADEKIQWQICKTLGCNIRKCDKGNSNNYEPAYVDSAPRYDVFPQYRDGNKPTMRPTYRAYHDSAYGDLAPRYDVFPQYSDGKNTPTNRPTYRAYTNNGYSTMRPTYRPYSTNYDVKNNAYDQSMYPNPDINANMYPNPIPNDAYPQHYVGGGYGN